MCAHTLANTHFTYMFILFAHISQCMQDVVKFSVMADDQESICNYNLLNSISSVSILIGSQQ